MFTGIIDHCGTITQISTIIDHRSPDTKVTAQPGSQQLKIKHSFSDLVLGESIAVNGICLTVTHFQDDIFSCDISPETLAVSAARYFQVGSVVNLERALQLSSRLGGHLVMGHVEQVCEVQKIQVQDQCLEMCFTGLTEQTRQFVMSKGSITINGVSLTINKVSSDGFAVMLIPHTLERTNLQHLKEGHIVNIEFDMMARIVVEQFQRLYGKESDILPSPVENEKLKGIFPRNPNEEQ